MARAGTVYLDFSGDFSKLHQQTAQAARQSEQAFKPVGGRIAASLGRGVGGAAREVGRTIQTGLVVATGATVALGGAAVKAAGEVTQLAKDTSAFSRASGLSAKESQAWVVTAKQRGIEVKQLQVGMATFGRQLTATGKAGSQSLNQLGLSQKELLAMPMADRMAAVADSFSKMADGPEKAAAAQRLFGRSAQQLLPILNEGGDAMREQLNLANDLVPPLGKAGKTALEFAKHQRTLKMALLGMRTEIGIAVLPILSKLAEQAIPLLNRGAQLLRRRIEKLQPIFKAVTDAIDIKRVGRLVDRFKDLGPAVAAVGTAFGAKLGGSLPIVGRFLGGINPVVGAIGALIASSPDLRKMFGDVLQRVFGAIKPLIGPVLKIFQDLAQGVLPILGRAIGAIVDAAGPLLKVLVEVAGNVLEGLKPAFAAVGQAIDALRPALNTIGQVLAQVAPVLGDMLVRAVNALAPLLPPIAEAFSEIVAAVGPLIPPLVDLADQMMSAMQPALKELTPLFSQMVKAIGPLLGLLAKLVAAVLPPLIKIIGAVFKVYMRFIGGVIGSPRKIAEAIGSIVEFFKGLPDKVWNAIKGVGEFFARIGRTWYRAMEQKVGEIIEWFKGLPGKIWNGIKAAAGFLGRVVRAWDRAMRQTLGDIIEFVKSLPGKFWNGIKRIAGFGQRLASQFLDGLKKLGGWIWDFVSGLPDRFWTGIKRIAGFGERLANRFMDGFRTLGDKALEFAKKIPGKVWDGVKDIFKIGKDAGKSFINGMIELINKGIRGINKMLPGKISMPGPIPDIPAIPKIPTIPRLHTGGLVTKDGVIPFQGFQRGGVVGRAGGIRRRPGVRDTVPALLEPGELVIPKGVNLADEAGKKGRDAMQALQDEFDRGYKDAGTQTTRFVADYGKGLAGATADTRKKIGQIRSDTVTGFARTTTDATRETAKLTQSVTASTRQVTGAYRGMSTEIGRFTGKVRQSAVADFTGMSQRTVQAATQQHKQVAGQFSGMQQQATRSTGRLRQTTVDDFQRTQRSASQHADQLRANTTRTVAVTRERIGKSTDGIRKATVQNFTGAQKGASDQTARIRDNTSRAAQQARTRLARASEGTKKDVVGNFDALGRGVGQGLGIIEGNLNKALSAMGVKKVSFSAKAAKAEKKQAGGSIVGGHGSGDKVPALLEPGEVVLNREAVKQLGGPRKANLANDLWPRFQRGGPVDAKGALPGLAALARAVRDKFGLGVTSGLRPGSVTTSGNRSDHAWGGAVDLSNGFLTPAMKNAAVWMARMAGFVYRPGVTAGGPIKQLIYETPAYGGHEDHIHVALQPDFARSAQRTAAVFGGGALEIPKVTLTGPDGPLAALGQAVLNQTRDAASEYLDQQMPDFGTTSAPGPGAISEAEFARYAMQALKLTGKFPATAGNVRLLLSRAKQESTLNPNAINNWDINAKRGDPSRGLMQTIGSTFNAYWQPGTSRNIYDPLANISAAINYMSARYRRIVGASGSGYQRGGIVQALAAGGIADWKRVQRLKELKRNPKKNAAAIRKLEAEIAQRAKLTKQQQKEAAAAKAAKEKAAAAAKTAKEKAAADKKAKALNAAELKKLNAQIKQAKDRAAQRLKQLAAKRKADALSKQIRQIQDLGVLPKRLRLDISGQTNWAEIYADWADRASALNVDPDETGLDEMQPADAQKELTRRWDAGLGRVFGGTEKQWRQKRLTELFKLRNSLLRAREILADALKKIARQLEQQRKKVQQINQKIKDGERRQRQTEDQINRLNKQLVTLRKNPQRNRQQIAQVERQRGKLQDQLAGIKENQKQRQAEKAQLTGKVIPALQDRQKASTDRRGELLDRVKDVQGLGSSMSRLRKLPKLGALGGQIFAVQMQLRELVPPKWTGEPPTPVDATAEDSSAGGAEFPDDSERAQLLEQLLREANQRTAVAERQFEVLRDFPPYLGSFARGLERVPGRAGQPWTATVHGGETITPAGQAGPVTVMVLVEDGAVDTSRIQAIANGEAQTVVRRQARTGGRVLPGTGGGVRR